MSLSQQAADSFRPPEKTGGLGAVQQVSVTNVAAEQVTTTRKGKFYVTFAAISGDVYIFFKNGTSAAGITTTTGYIIPSGQERSWWIETNRLDRFEHITTATATLKWYISSPLYEQPNLGQVAGT